MGIEEKNAGRDVKNIFNEIIEENFPNLEKAIPSLV